MGFEQCVFHKVYMCGHHISRNAEYPYLQTGAKINI